MFYISHCRLCLVLQFVFLFVFQGTEYEHAMVTVVDAFNQLHCSEGILGLLEWSKKVVGRDFFWLYAAISKAKGRYGGFWNF